MYNYDNCDIQCTVVWQTKHSCESFDIWTFIYKNMPMIISNSSGQVRVTSAQQKSCLSSSNLPEVAFVSKSMVQNHKKMHREIITNLNGDPVFSLGFKLKIVIYCS